MEGNCIFFCIILYVCVIVFFVGWWLIVNIFLYVIKSIIECDIISKKECDKCKKRYDINKRIECVIRSEEL